MLRVGYVYVPNTKDQCAEYVIRDSQVLTEIILPIFDRYTLLTSKQYNYDKFRKALLIYTDRNLSLLEKDTKLTELKGEVLPLDYVSIAWKLVNISSLTKTKSESIISKDWLVGFTEAEGSFYLVNKSANRMSHVFEITQKLDKILLYGISFILPMKVYKKNSYFTCISTNRKAVEEIIRYFHNTMKGMKSLEYRI